MKKINLAVIGASLVPALAMAEEAHAAATPGNAYAFLGAGLCMGIASAVVGYSQSRAAVAALESIGRNPASAKTVFTPFILSLALMESLVLFAYLVASTLAGK